MIMFLNYIKLSLRLFARNPVFTFINVAGLSVGFAVFFVLWIYSKSELETDRFHADWDRMFRISNVLQWTDDGVTWAEPSKFATTPAILANHLTSLYPQIESYTRMLPQICFEKVSDGGNTSGHGRDVLISRINQNGQRQIFKEENIIYADRNFFEFFSIPLIKGDARSVLNQSRSVLLSRSKANIYFGREDPIGQLILLNDSISLMVSGVFEDVPNNSHFTFDIVLSTERIKNNLDRPRKYSWVYSYVKLMPGINPNDLQERMNNEQSQFIKTSAWGNVDNRAQIFFQPLSDIAFAYRRNDVHSAKSRSLLVTLRIAAWIVLGMAWINYIIQTISFNYKRDKEQFIRRTVGSHKVDMAKQFLAESISIHFISLLTTFTLIQLMRDPLDLLFGIYVHTWASIPITTKILFVTVSLASICLTTLVPLINTLLRVRHTKQSISGRNDIYYNGLTAFQLGLAIVLVTATFCVYQQNRFILTKDIGLNRENVVLIDLPPEPPKDFAIQLKTFLQSIDNMKEITAVTASYSAAGNEFHNYVYIGKTGTDISTLVESDGGVDANFIPFYQIKLLLGRNFIEENPVDSSTVILSVGALKRLGFESTEAALGQRIDAGQKKDVEIIGIVEDYQLRPFLKGSYGDESYDGKPGLVLTYKDYLHKHAKFRTVSVKIQPGEENSAIAKLEKQFLKSFPQSAFNFNFLNDVINSRYLNYKRLLNQITLFAALAIGIVVVGLSGVFAKKIAARIKEIGIRKVLGADGVNLGYLLAKGTAKQFFFSTCVGVAISFYLNQEYQMEFAEQFDMPVWQYLVPVFILATIIFFTVGIVIRSALKRNPVEALKCE